MLRHPSIVVTSRGAALLLALAFALLLTTPAHASRTITLPAWELHYGTTVLDVAGPGPGADLVLRGPHGPTGISQYLAPPNDPATLRIVGSSARPIRVVVRWSRTRANELEEVYVRALRGRVSLPVRPPDGADGLRVAVTQLDEGVDVRLASVSVRVDDGPERLRNPGLVAAGCSPSGRGGVRELESGGPCPPQSVRVPAAGTPPPVVRWLLTLLGLAVLAAVLVRAARGPDAPEDDAPPPERRVMTPALAGVALAGVVSVGTFKVGVRLVWSDLLLAAALLLLLLAPGALKSALGRSRAVRTAVAAAAALLLVTLAGTLLALTHTSDNLAGLGGRAQLVADIGTPFERAVVDGARLLFGVAAFLVVLVLGRRREDWVRLARAFVLGAAAVAALGLLILLNDRFGRHVTLPGEYPSWTVLRASATFPEPTAFGGFAVCALAFCAVAWRVTGARWALLAGLVVGVGALATQSSAALVGLLPAAVAIAVLLPRRVLVVAAAAAAVALVGVVATGVPERVTDVLEKPLGRSNSAVDREVTWGAAARMGEAYAPLGAGRAQFAFNTAPFVEPVDQARAGRPQSGVLEVWAEQGPLGLALAAVLLGCAVATRRRTGRADATHLAAAATLAVVFATYFTTTYVWPWILLGLLVTAPRARRRDGRSAPPAPHPARTPARTPS